MCDCHFPASLSDARTTATFSHIDIWLCTWAQATTLHSAATLMTERSRPQNFTMTVRQNRTTVQVITLVPLRHFCNVLHLEEFLGLFHKCHRNKLVYMFLLHHLILLRASPTQWCCQHRLLSIKSTPHNHFAWFLWSDTLPIVASNFFSHNSRHTED